MQLPKEEALDPRQVTLLFVPPFNSVLLIKSSHLKGETFLQVILTLGGDPFTVVNETKCVYIMLCIENI